MPTYSVGGREIVPLSCKYLCLSPQAKMIQLKRIFPFATAETLRHSQVARQTLSEPCSRIFPRHKLSTQQDQRFSVCRACREKIYGNPQLPSLLPPFGIALRELELEIKRRHINLISRLGKRERKDANETRLCGGMAVTFVNISKHDDRDMFTPSVSTIVIQSINC
jgi:hypothetical protein